MLLKIIFARDEDEIRRAHAPDFGPLVALVPMIAGIGGTTAATAGTAAAAAGTAAATAGSVGAAAIGTAAGASSLFSMSSILSGLGILGTGLQMISGVKQANTQADILEANAKQLRAEGDSIVEQSKGEQFKLSRERRQAIGRQVATIGASGTDYSGSNLDIIADTAKNFEEDIQQLGYQGDATARTRYNAADTYEWEAPNRRRAGWWSALGTAATGLGKLALTRRYGLA